MGLWETMMAFAVIGWERVNVMTSVLLYVDTCMHILYSTVQWIIPLLVTFGQATYRCKEVAASNWSVDLCRNSATGTKLKRHDHNKVAAFSVWPFEMTGTSMHFTVQTCLRVHPHSVWFDSARVGLLVGFLAWFLTYLPWLFLDDEYDGMPLWVQ